MAELTESARIDFDELQQQLSLAVQGLVSVSNALSEITSKLHTAKNSSSMGELWARTWGETLPKKAAAKMLGVSVTYLNKLIAEGGITATPDGRVAVRSAAEWANSIQMQIKVRKQKWHI